MTGQQLKNSILQMAVQGKLVPQDPNDEPASVLLERIRKEKEQLIKEGKIKKEKNPSYIFRGADNLPYEKVGKNEPVCIADEVPFEIPDSWEWVRLGNIFAIEMGQSPEGNTVSENGDGLEFHQGKVFFSDYIISHSKQRTSAPTKIAVPNSVLLCVRAPVGKVNITDRKLCIGRGLCAIKPLAGMSVDFVFHLLEAYENIFIKQATGTTFIAITGEVVKNQLIPLPPLFEQGRIATAIPGILPYVKEYSKQETQLTKLNKSFPEQLKKSILQEAVQGKLVPQDPSDEPASVLLERIHAEKEQLIKTGKIKRDKHESVIYRRDNSHYEKLDGIERCIDDEIPFEIPESWSWIRLGGLLKIESGDGLTSREMKTGNIPVYGGNGITGYHNSQNVFAETVVIGRVGYYCGSVHITPSAAWVTDNAFITTYPEKYINREYLVYTLRHMNLGKNNNATAQPVVSGKKIYPLLFPLPPLLEQARIVAKLNEALKTTEKL